MTRARFPMPETDPARPCSQCNAGQDRGDRRCERHGRIIVDDAERERLYPPPPRRKPVPRGHVARAIAEGKRPFLTCTIDPDTFRAIDRLAAARNVSRGRLIDAAIAILAVQDAPPEDAPTRPATPSASTGEASPRPEARTRS